MLQNSQMKGYWESIGVRPEMAVYTANSFGNTMAFLSLLGAQEMRGTPLLNRKATSPSHATSCPRWSKFPILFSRWRFKRGLLMFDKNFIIDLHSFFQLKRWRNGWKDESSSLNCQPRGLYYNRRTLPLPGTSLSPQPLTGSNRSTE